MDGCMDGWTNELTTALMNGWTNKGGQPIEWSENEWYDCVQNEWMNWWFN